MTRRQENVSGITKEVEEASDHPRGDGKQEAVMDPKRKRWLERQVTRLAKEIAASDVFESAEPASREQILELRRTIVIHRFLVQELARMAAASEASSHVDRFIAA